MMKKTVIAALVAVCAMMLTSVPTIAQEAQSTQNGQSDTAKAAMEANVQLMREDLRSQRKQITAANVTLHRTKQPSSGQSMTNTSRKLSRSTIPAGL